jgi:oligopeptide/dipeptide ABC transporter ATP-binding protein
MATQPLLDVRDLVIALQVEEGLVPVVDGISFALESGKVLGLVGESGCGKSVSSHAILRLLPDELRLLEGRILFRTEDEGAAVDIARLDPRGREIRTLRGRRIGIVFQEPMSSFSPIHTIGDQIEEVIRLHLRVGRKEARERAVELLDKVEIADPARALDRYPHEFSGGMRQRAMIAKALACNPALLIADEPTTALDVTIQAQILELFLGLQAEFGMGVVFITHDLGVVAQIAHDVAIMYLGKIVEHGPVREIFHHPRHPYTASLIEAIPRLGRLRDARPLEPIKGSVPSIFRRPMGCPFHPRCDSFMAGRCETTFPRSTRLVAEHRVSCHLYG